jgi:hypothetical protein
MARLDYHIADIKTISEHTAKRLTEARRYQQMTHEDLRSCPNDPDFVSAACAAESVLADAERDFNLLSDTLRSSLRAMMSI